MYTETLSLHQKLKTLKQFDRAAAECRTIFEKKTSDYGDSWQVLRPSSLTDQLYIKAKRIRSIEEKGRQKVADAPEEDYKGIVNYSVMALIRLNSEGAGEEPGRKELMVQYDNWIAAARVLMTDKNHDYGEVWREMRLSSITDLILMKLLRIKQIEDNSGKTLISEGLEANYLDIINYAIFALIRIEEEKENGRHK